MQTYRRFASTASSTSRSASTSIHHGGHGHPPHTLSRSGSTTGTSSTTTLTTSNESSGAAARGLTLTMPSSATPSGIARALAAPSNNAMGNTRSPGTPYGTLSSSSNLNLSPDSYNTTTVATTAAATTNNGGSSSSRDPYTQSDLHTIAESLLAHVTFGPYHIASSPVPSSHMHTLLAASQSSRNKENVNNASSNSLSSSNASLYPGSYSGQYATGSVLGPSSRRQFEGKEGSHNHNASHSHSSTTSSGQPHRLASVNYPLPPMSQLSLSPSSTPHSHSQTPRSNHPRARFTIGPEERGRGRRGSEDGARGRGLGRKSVGGVGASARESSSSELWELDEEDEGRERGRERDRGGRGRRGDVKVLQQ